VRARRRAVGRQRTVDAAPGDGGQRAEAATDGGNGHHQTALTVPRIGRDIAPEKTILFVDESRLHTLDSRRPIPVGLDPEFLQARVIALVAFDGLRSPSR